MKNLGLSFGDNVVVKVGSNVLVGNSLDKEDIDFGINHKNVRNVVNSVDYLMDLGLNVFLVSSGAVAIGRRELEKNGIIFEGKLTDTQKAFLSGNGQINLMSLYRKLFLEKGKLITQNLLTHKNFTCTNIFENLKDVWQLNISNRVVAIINENDVISREELKFSDNDQLAGFVAEAINAKVLFLLSDIDGIYKNYGTKKQVLIDSVIDINEVRKYVINEQKKGGVGSGGMKSKLDIFQYLQNKGIMGVLANGGEIDIIKDIIEGSDCKKTIFLV